MIARSHSIITDRLADGDGNLDGATAAQFVDPRLASETPTTAGDYRLISDTPHIDADLNASNTAMVDAAGGPRVLDGNEDGTATIDVGALEFQNNPDLRTFVITAIS